MGHKVPQSQYFHGLWHSFFFSTVKDGIISLQHYKINLQYFSPLCKFSRRLLYFFSSSSLVPCGGLLSIAPTILCGTYGSSRNAMSSAVNFTENAPASDFPVNRFGRESSREFDSCIIKIVRAGRIKPVLFLSSFLLYYLVIFSDM